MFAPSGFPGNNVIIIKYNKGEMSKRKNVKTEKKFCLSSDLHEIWHEGGSWYPNIAGLRLAPSFWNHLAQSYFIDVTS